MSDLRGNRSKFELVIQNTSIWYDVEPTAINPHQSGRVYIRIVLFSSPPLSELEVFTFLQFSQISTQYFRMEKGLAQFSAWPK